MNQFTVSVEIKAPELVEAICLLASAIGVDKSRVTPAKTTQKKDKPKPPVDPEPTEAPPEENPTTELEPTGSDDPVVTLDEVRAKVTQLAKSGKQAEAQALIARFGGAKLSDIDPSKYAELIKAAEALLAPAPDSEEVPTVVELRAVAQEKGKTPEGKAAIKALLNEFGSKSVSDVPEEKRAAFLTALGKL